MEQLFGVAIIEVVYHSTLATLTLIIYFPETLKKNSNFFFSNSQFCEGKYCVFKDILFPEMKISNLINYLTDMC
jgi:hypothetical protein